MTAALRPTEEQCEDAIVEAAIALGFRVHVERKARTKDGWRTPVKGHKGWPDMCIAGHGVFIVRELKRRPAMPTANQYAWIAGLVTAGVDADVLWVPDGQQAFIDHLTAIATKGTSP